MNRIELEWAYDDDETDLFSQLRALCSFSGNFQVNVTHLCLFHVILRNRIKFQFPFVSPKMV